MIRKIAKLATASSLCALLGVACHSAATSERATPAEATAAKPVPELAVSDVVGLVKDKSATVFDANDGDTRKEYGVVPGAVLLSSSKDYPLSVLPAEKTNKLVFYCGGTQCRSSDKAAERAANAGYTDVNVMRAGIRGWKAAGQATATAPQS